jgi:uncharacterized membrane protein YeaQ/YmgE (transglycosylase-associated protein family)
MGLVQLLLLLIIAAACGAAGQALAGYSLGGCLVSIVVGFIGAWLGMYLAGATGMPELLMVNVGGQPFPIIWSILGAAVFAFLVGLVTRSWRGRRTTY